MSAGWLTVVPLLPLAAAALAWHRRGAWLAPLAVLPALLAAAWMPTGASSALPWLMLGTELRLDGTGRVFLLFSALLWLASAVYGVAAQRSEPSRGRFLVFFLLAMAGNFALILAADMGTFFFGFALMGLATYGLVAHRRSAGARRAGRIYLGWTIAGEVALFSGVVLLAGGAGGLGFDDLAASAPSHAAVALVLLGLGIKLAVPGLHAWLPLAYRAAPPAAAAVMSGAMIKAGVLGMLRFLPPGSPALVSWGEVLVPLGLFAAFFGVAVGLTQRSPRVVLGYSSISQMGVLLSALGVAMAEPSSAPALAAAITLFAAHHALAKGVLFLGLDGVRRSGGAAWALVALALPALALAGAPFTSGALAKAALGQALPAPWQSLTAWLTAGSVATTLLMARLLWLAARRGGRVQRGLPRAAIAAWAGLLSAVLAWPLLLATPYGGGALPVLVGAALAGAVVLVLPDRLLRRTPRIPAGDLPILLYHQHRAWVRGAAVRRPLRGLPPIRPPDLIGRFGRRAARADAEAALRRWPVAGLLWLGLTALVWVLALR